jgi:hypothetical protein
MARYIAGQVIRVFTADDDGNLGPFVNQVTGEPVSPSEVVCSFRIEQPAPPQGITPVPGPTITVVMGTPFDYDEFNPAITIEQDETTLGYYFFLNTTLFLTGVLLVPPMANLRTQWASSGTDSAISPSKLDTIWPSDLQPAF